MNTSGEISLRPVLAVKAAKWPARPVLSKCDMSLLQCNLTSESGSFCSHESMRLANARVRSCPPSGASFRATVVMSLTN